jgi:uncharacterized protein (TIGR02246 family)
MRRAVVAIVMLAASAPLAAAESCVSLEPKAVAALFDEWNFALSSLDAAKVTQRYWSNAVLLPTASNTPRTDAAMIDDYFEHFLAKRPRGRIDTRTVQTGCNVAMDMGTYTFSLMDDKGMTSEVAARYTFIYQYRDGGWKILHHHSSAMPEAVASATPEDAHSTPDKAPVTAKPAPTGLKGKGKEKETRKTAGLAEALATKPFKSSPSDARTALFANMNSSPPPSQFYPPEAAKKKEHGHVNLKVCADDSGTIAEMPEVVNSSGSKSLDDAAQSWARAATWVPATLNHQRVEDCTLIIVAFDATA